MAAVSPVTSSALNAGSAAAAAPAQSAQSINFMKLLVAQMQNQNPMNPQNGTEFMTQIAQFSQLDAMTQLNQNFTDLLTIQGLAQGANLIGTTVSFTNPAGATARGVVSSVALNNGKVQLVVGGTPVDLTKIRTVEA